jgi:hypothetical protein
VALGVWHCTLIRSRVISAKYLAFQKYMYARFHLSRLQVMGLRGDNSATAAAKPITATVFSSRSIARPCFLAAAVTSPSSRISRHEFLLYSDLDSPSDPIRQQTTAADCFMSF